MAADENPAAGQSPAVPLSLRKWGIASQYTWVLEVVVLGLACVWVVGPSTLLEPDVALGPASRDLYDHLALLDLWSLQVDDWNYPNGGSLAPPDLFGMLFAAPWIGWLSRATAYNLAVVSQLWAASIAAWALGRRVGVGLVAGVAFGLSPFLVGQAMSGEAETLSAWPLPLWALLLTQDSRKAWAGAGVMGALAAVGSWYYGAFAAMVTAGWAGVRLLRDRDPGVLLAPGIFALTIAPWAWVYLDILHSPEQLFAGPDMRAYLDLYPQALASMSANPLVWMSQPSPKALHIDSLGAFTVALAAVGWWGWKTGPKTSSTRLFWLTMLALGLALSVGPRLHFDGVVVTEWTPYRLLADLPVFGRMRMPHRWTLVATLGLAVLAARGARHMPLAATVFIFIETVWFLAPPPTTTSVPPHAAIEHITGPVLDLPPRTLQHDARGRYLVWQRTHGQPTPYALLMQAWSPAIAQEPLFIAVAAEDSQFQLAGRTSEARQFRQEDFALAVLEWRENPDEDALAGAADRLTDLGFSQVLLHREMLSDYSDSSLMRLLTDHLGEPVVERPVAVWDL